MGRSGFNGLPVLAVELVSKVRETVKGGIKGVGFLAGGYIEKMKQTGNYRNLIHIRDRDLRTGQNYQSVSATSSSRTDPVDSVEP